MISNISSSLRLNIWRSCRWRKQYLDTRNNGIADVTSYQECLYSWEPFGDPFSSLTNSEQTQRLREELIEKFSLENPFSERGIENLQQAIQVINEILSKDGESSWGDSEETRSLSNGDNINLRQHQLLALSQHLQWVCDTFVNVPSVNVSFH